MWKIASKEHTCSRSVYVVCCGRQCAKISQATRVFFRVWLVWYLGIKRQLFLDVKPSLADNGAQRNLDCVCPVSLKMPTLIYYTTWTNVSHFSYFLKFQCELKYMCSKLKFSLVLAMWTRLHTSLSTSSVLLHLHVILLTVDIRSLDNIRRFVQFGPSDSIPAFSGSDVWFFVFESCRVENERPSE